MDTKFGGVAKRLLLFFTFVFILNLTDCSWNLVIKFGILSLENFNFFVFLFQRPKDLKVENIKQCPIDEDSPIVVEVFDVTQPERQKYSLNSTIRILSDIPGHIYVCPNQTVLFSFAKLK